MTNNTLRDWLETFSDKHGLAVAEPLSPADEYAKLGGDAALVKLLEAEDRFFMTQIEKERTLAKDREHALRIEWQKKLATLTPIITGVRATIEREQARYDNEKPQLDALKAEVSTFGEKRETEAGKEVMELLRFPTWDIDRTPTVIANDRKWLAGAEDVAHALKQRLRDADAAFEAVEERLRNTRVEARNLLELRSMRLEERVARLRGGAAQARAEAQGRLEQEIASIRAATEQRIDEELGKFEPTYSPYVAPPFDWKAIEKKIAYVHRTPLEELQETDRAHARLLRKYERAGGDEALYRERVSNWQIQLDLRDVSQKRKSEALLRDSERLRAQIGQAERRLAEAEEGLIQLRKTQRSLEARAQKLTSGASEGDLLSDREAAELQVSARESKRIEQRIADQEKEVAARRKALASAEELEEKRRAHNEARIDDDQWEDLPKPQPQDIEALPLKKKYAELMGL